MKAFFLILLLGLSGLYADNLTAGTMGKISSDIYKIQDAFEKLNRYTVQHSSDENEVYIQDLSETISKHIQSIQTNWQKLGDNESLKVPLKNYLEQWDEASIRNSLRNGDGQFMSDTGYISSLLPPRKRWQTLFPVFRA